MTAHDGVLDDLARFAVIPVVEVEQAAAAVPLARTLAESGLPVIELTLRTSAALEAIERVVGECPDVLVGAGTLLDAQMVTAASAAGAKFGVSPGLSTPCLTAAADADLAFIPGVVTPSDAIAALDAGLRHLKFFPAEAYGGISTLKALAGPLAATGVRFMPTGGITAANAGDYLAMEAVFAVGGTWIAPRSDISAGRWHDIADRARAATDLVRSLALEASS